MRVAALALSLIVFAAPAMAESPYASLVARVCQTLRVSPDLVHAVINAESNYDARAVSSAGALGLMQLIPKYGALEAYRYLYGYNAIPTNESLLRPAVNIWLGTAYLRILRDRYFGWINDPRLRLLAVIAAYNWGPTATLDAIFPDRQAGGVAQFVRELDQYAPIETRRYVRRVLDTMRQRRNQAKGQT